jgi:hypothetical protein
MLKVYEPSSERLIVMGRRLEASRSLPDPDSGADVSSTGAGIVDMVVGVEEVYISPRYATPRKMQGGGEQVLKRIIRW